jgi:hypothetical protein
VPAPNSAETFTPNIGSVGKLVKGVDGYGKMSLNEGNSRRSCDQEGANLNITNFPTEPNISESDTFSPAICKLFGGVFR